MERGGNIGSDHKGLSGNRRAKRLGFAISHADGCPGVHFPGIGIVWDDRLPDKDKHAFIDFLVARKEKR